MDDYIKAAFLFKVLPDEVKKANGIKVNPKNPRFDLIAEYSTGSDFIHHLYNKSGQVALTMIQADHMVQAHPNRRADHLLQNANIGNLTSLYYSDLNNKGRFYGYCNPNPRIKKGKESIANPLQRYCRDLLLIQLSEDGKTLIVILYRDGKNYQQYLYPKFVNGEMDDAIATILGFMDYPNNYESL
jgi:hypothetical protein